MIFSALAVVGTIFFLLVGGANSLPIVGVSSWLGSIVAILMSCLSFACALYAYIDIQKAETWGLRCGRNMQRAKSLFSDFLRQGILHLQDNIPCRQHTSLYIHFAQLLGCWQPDILLTHQRLRHMVHLVTARGVNAGRQGSGGRRLLQRSSNLSLHPFNSCRISSPNTFDIASPQAGENSPLYDNKDSK